MNITELVAAYNRIDSRHRLPGMAVARLSIAPTRHLDPGAAWAELQTLAPLAGWLQFQSKVVTFTGGVLPELLPAWGVLLDAACHDAAGRSILVRSQGAGQLTLVIATPDSEDTSSKVMLVDDHRHLATGKAPGQALRYRRYWRIDPDRGAVPYFAAFQGFASQEGE